VISFVVHGRPQPQGSTKAFIPKGWKRAIITTDNKNLKPWRQDVASEAMAAMSKAGAKLSEEAIHVEVAFFFLRPKSVNKSVIHKTTKPDIDKLERGILDGLTGICFRDDSQVVSCIASKGFCDSNERAEIEVRVVTAEPGNVQQRNRGVEDAAGGVREAGRGVQV
jgi:crossover junction endodeoxyribonuclease RusA